MLQREKQMKTLVNKANPQIRITAPEEAVKERPSCWAIWPEGYKGYRSLLLDKDNWTLVEEEPADLEKEIDACWRNWLSPSNQKEVEEVLPKAEFAMHARHFYRLGLSTRKGELEHQEVNLEEFTEKMDAWKARFNRPDNIPIKATMAFTARMFYQYPDVARQWYEQLPKTTMDFNTRKEE